MTFLLTFARVLQWFSSNTAAMITEVMLVRQQIHSIDRKRDTP